MYSIGKRHHFLNVTFQKYSKESFFEDVVCENCFSGSYETIKVRFTMCRNLKEPPLGFKILLQRGRYGMTTDRVIKNGRKIDIPLECFYSIPSCNEKLVP